MNVVLVAHKNYLKKSDRYSLINIIEDKTKDIKVIRSFNKITDILSREITFNIAPHKIVIVDSVDIKKPRKADYTMADFICDIKENSTLAEKNIDVVYLFGRKNINDESVRTLTRLLIDNGFYSISLGAVQSTKIIDMIREGNTKEQAENFYKSLFNGGVAETEKLVAPPKEVSVEETLNMVTQKENEVNAIYEKYAGNDTSENYTDDYEPIEDEPEPETSLMDEWEKNKNTEKVPSMATISQDEEESFDLNDIFADDEDIPVNIIEEDIQEPIEPIEVEDADKETDVFLESEGDTINDLESLDDIFLADEEGEQEMREDTERNGDVFETPSVDNNDFDLNQQELFDMFNSVDDDKDDFQDVVDDFNIKAKEEKRESLKQHRDEIIDRYNKKEPLTEDEFVYVMCDYHPNKDSDIQLSAYTDGYAKYMNEVNELKKQAETQKKAEESRKSKAELPPTVANNDDIEPNEDDNGIIDVSFEALSESTNDFSDLSVSNRTAIDVTEPSDESDLHVWDRVTEYERETKEIIGCVTVGVTQLLNRTGCTHISVEVANVLYNNGYDVGICLMNDDTFTNLQTYLDIPTEMDGVFEYDGLKYYNAASLYYAQSEHQIIVIDFGVMNENNLNEFERARVKLMVCDGSAWSVHKFEDFIMHTNKPYIKSIHYLFNLQGKERYKQLFEPLENEGYYTHRVSMSESPFESNKENTEMYFNALDSIISNDNIISNRRKKPKRVKNKRQLGLPFFG